MGEVALYNVSSYGNSKWGNFQEDFSKILLLWGTEMIKTIQQSLDLNQGNITIRAILAPSQLRVLCLDSSHNALEIVLHHLAICQFSNRSQDPFKNFLKNSLFAEMHACIKIHEVIDKCIVTELINAFH